MKERIEQLSDGKIKVNLHFGTLGGERELIESVQLNSIQAAPVTTGPMGGFVQLSEIFMIPFLFRDWTHVFSSVDGALGQRLNELCVEQDFRILGWWGCGSRTILGIGSPVSKPDDLKGKKIRIMESQFLSLLYSAYGAIPTPMAYSEVFTALQQGAIDGEQTIKAVVSGGYRDIIKWVCDMEEIYQVVPFLVSETWWQSLPKEAQRIIMQAQIEAEIMERDYMTWDFAQYDQAWISVGVTPTKVDVAAFQSIAEGLYPKFKELLDDDEGWFDWVVALGKPFPYTYPKTGFKYEF
jgi:TRAP-type C4-dicarboxylate transport system substrate-binding protein